MKDNSRSLTLTIEASNPDDFNALLRQARYEIEKLLPLPPEATEEARSRAAAKTIYSDASKKHGLITKGHSSGTLGRYEFEMVIGSREYAEIERELLNEGYERRPLTDRFGLEADHPCYMREEHEIKIIDGSPLAIRDYVPGDYL